MKTYALIVLAVLLASCTATGPTGERTDHGIEQPRAICPDCEPPYHPLPVRR